MRIFYLQPLILFLLTLSVYSFFHKGEVAHLNYFVPLADGFLKGHLYVIEHPPWLNELINWQGNYYVVYPPMPAILLMPFVKVFGSNFYQPFFSILAAALSVALSYLVFLKIFGKRSISIFTSLLYGFGTITWYHAQAGSAWYIAHIVALFFLWLMLLETLTKQRLFLIGLFIGAAYLSRLPTIMALVFVLIYLKEKFFSFKVKKIYFKNIFLLGLGIAPFILFNFLYNYLRFGVINDISYSLLPVFNEPWYKYGLFNIRYLPTHLVEIFTALPIVKPYPPFVIPSIYVMALWVTTPAFILILFANFKDKLIQASGMTALIMSLPDLLHGSNGFTQFGYRFSLDYLPFLLILAASGMRGRVGKLAILLILVSIVINLWGVIMISHLNLTGF